DVAERGCGERREHGVVTGDGVGDAFAADQAGADELERVAAVDLCAARADGGAAVAARFVDHPVGQVGDRDAAAVSGGRVDVLDVGGEADRAGTPGGRTDVVQPGVVVAATGPSHGLPAITEPRGVV